MTSTTKPTPTLDTIRAQREQIIALAEQYGASNVRVFGSVARGAARLDSDIDFLVTAKPGTSVFEMVGLWREMQTLLDCEVSLITDSIDDAEFLRRIAHDAIPL